MSAPERRRFLLGNETHRQLVGTLVVGSPPRSVVTIDPPGRTLDQNSLLHALIADAVQGGLAADDGRRLTFNEAKVAFVSAWMMEEGHESDIIAFAGHPVQLRRSTTELSKDECSRLIEFIMAACALRGVTLRERNA